MRTKRYPFPFQGYALMLLSGVSFYIALQVQGGTVQAIMAAKGFVLLAMSRSSLAVPSHAAFTLHIRPKKR